MLFYFVNTLTSSRCWQYQRNWRMNLNWHFLKSGLYTAIRNGKKRILKSASLPNGDSSARTHLQFNSTFALLRPPSFPRKTRQAKTKMTLALLTHQKSLQTRMPLYKRSPPATFADRIWHSLDYEFESVILKDALLVGNQHKRGGENKKIFKFFGYFLEINSYKNFTYHMFCSQLW